MATVGSVKIAGVLAGASLLCALTVHDARGAACTGGQVATIAGGAGSGPAISVGQDPYFLAVRGNELLVAELNLNWIRSIDLMSGEETLLTGTDWDGQRPGDGLPIGRVPIRPYGMAADAAGNLYIHDSYGGARIRKVSPFGIVSTIAGGDNGGFSGDGGQSTAALLGGAGELAVDASGNLYIADTDNQRIRKITPAGVISTIAGTGTQGFSGDGGSATLAQLNSPEFIAVGPDGSVYVSDYGNERVRRIDSSGVITTVVGNGTGGFSGDGGPATAAALDLPLGMAVGSDGTLFIADSDNNRIRAIDGSGTITTVAGTGLFGNGGDGGLAVAAQLAHPTDVVLDAAGNLYVTSTKYIRRIDAITQVITTIAGNGFRDHGGDGGPATAAQFVGVNNVAHDGMGNIYIAENAAIRRIDPSGVVTTVAGTAVEGFAGDGGPATAAQLHYPFGIAVDSSGNVLVADTYNFRIRKIDTSGTITTIAGNGTPGDTGDEGPATAASFDFPRDVAVDGAGNIYVSDSTYHRVRRIDAGGTIHAFAGRGTPGFSGDGGPATAAQLQLPIGVLTVGTDVLIADHNNGRIRKVDAGGTISTFAGIGTGYNGEGKPALATRLTPEELSADAAGNVYVSESDRVRRIDAATAIVTTVAGDPNSNDPGATGPATALYISSRCVDADAVGNLLICDSIGARLRRLDAGVGCGNCVVDPGEACDDGNGSSNDACKNDCTFNVCGDGSVWTGIEVCDDGNTADGDGCAGDCASLLPESVSASVGPGMLIVSTDSESDDATAGDPVETEVQVPIGTTSGTVSITEASAPPAPQAGVAFLGTLVTVTVTGITPPPTTTSPLVLRFYVDGSLIPPDQDAASITVIKDGTTVPDCGGPAGSAVPDPCVSDRQVIGGGDAFFTILTTTASDWAFSITACGNAPRQGCQAAAAGKAKLKLKESGAKDTLVWVWKSSADTGLPLFGHPDADTSYSLCLYDAEGVRLQVDVPAAGICGTVPCWSASLTGFLYKSMDGEPDGARKLLTVAGDAGKAKIVLKAKGPALSVPSLPITLPVLVQASTSDGVCFEASYTAAKINDTTLYSGRSDP